MRASSVIAALPRRALIATSASRRGLNFNRLVKRRASSGTEFGTHISSHSFSTKLYFTLSFSTYSLSFRSRISFFFATMARVASLVR